MALSNFDYVSVDDGRETVHIPDKPATMEVDDELRKLFTEMLRNSTEDNICQAEYTPSGVMQIWFVTSHQDNN